MHRRAQSAIEFMIIVGAMLFFFILFLVVLYTQQADSYSEQRNLAVKEIAFTIQDEISLASSSRDGYERIFRLPETVINVDYNASIQEGRSVYVRTLDDRHALALPVVNVTGQVRKGDNVIKKVNGTVYLNS